MTGTGESFLSIHVKQRCSPPSEQKKSLMIQLQTHRPIDQIHHPLSPSPRLSTVQSFEGRSNRMC